MKRRVRSRFHEWLGLSVLLIPGVVFATFQSTSVTLEKGTFLVAKPGMEDPRFRRSVILLVEHSAGGTLGFIINRSTDVPLARVLPDLELPDENVPRLFYGGPVQLNALMFLSRSEEPLEGASLVMEDVYFGRERKLLERLLSQTADQTRLRLYAGYSGWGAGQLEAEIARGDWRLVSADAHTLFEKDLDAIWPDLAEPSPSPGRFIVWRLEWPGLGFTLLRPVGTEKARGEEIWAP